ncbi:MAG TPA: hypothetical protein DCY88_25450, partial [Cyanobacteria bacterium UBA11372]|nr:hypothetical protein [Cyanobacteria bacterium UBA11372]
TRFHSCELEFPTDEFSEQPGFLASVLKLFDCPVPTFWCCTQLKTAVLAHRLWIVGKNYYDP